jgi:hypothetical protein
MPPSVIKLNKISLAVLIVLLASIPVSGQVNQGECIQSNQGPAYAQLAGQTYQAYMNCATNGPLFISKVVQSGSGSGSSLAITSTSVLIDAQGTPAMKTFNNELYTFFAIPNNANQYPIAFAASTNGTSFQINTTTQRALEPDFGAAVFNSQLPVTWRDVSKTGFNLGIFDPSTEQFSTVRHFNTQVATTPDLAVFNSKLYLCFERSDFTTIEIDDSTDAINFVQTATIHSSGVSIAGEPKMAAVSGKLVVAWTQQDINPFQLISFLSTSTTGTSFTSAQVLPANSTSQLGISPPLSSGLPFLGWSTFENGTSGTAFIETKCFFC